MITCEHGGNRVPAPYRNLFINKQRLLRSHRGWDPGALPLARELARALRAKLVYSETTRLLIDLNRSVHHSRLFSEVTNTLDRMEKEKIVNTYYQPYRNEVEQYIRRQIKCNQAVIHFSVHSFVASLNKTTRNADIGLLYDPVRHCEKVLCHKLQQRIQREAPRFKIRRNYPYRGTADGFTTYLRKCFRDGKYLGIELEVNQRFVVQKKADWRETRKSLTGAVEKFIWGNSDSRPKTSHR